MSLWFSETNFRNYRNFDRNKMSLWINYGYYDNSFPRKNIIIHILCKQSGKAERVSKIIHIIHIRFLINN